MVNFEKSTPENQPGLLKSQWYNDAGVRRGVDPEVAADIGYKDPRELHPDVETTAMQGTALEPHETAAARKIVDGQTPEKRYQTAAEKRLLHSRALLEQLGEAGKEVKAEQTAAEETRTEKTLRTLRETDPNRIGPTPEADNS